MWNAKIHQFVQDYNLKSNFQTHKRFPANFVFLGFNNYLVYKREMENLPNSGSDSFTGEDQAQPPSQAELAIL
jgi:hypothetical protein